MVEAWSHLEIARSYAARGWPVLPLHSIRKGRCSCGGSACRTPGKHPRTEHGVKDATTDDGLITSWWTETPDANIGIATGTASGLVVVDVDPRHDGLDSLAGLDLPTTRTVETGGGGWHFFFRLAIAVRSHDLAPGVEFRGDGSYVVAPPSNHLHGSYRWLDETVPIVEAPAIALNGTAPAKGPIVIEPDQKRWFAETLLRECPEGQRNSTLTRLAGHLRLTETRTVALAILSLWNATQCRPPMDAAEVRRTVEGIWQRYPGMDHQPIELWTGSSLLGTAFAPLSWVVEDLLPEGLAFLGGRPKRGKSYLALQVAIDCVSGGASLGSAGQGKVVYFALEDSPRRLQQRLRQMHGPASDDLIFVTHLAPLEDGGQQALVETIERFRPILVVVDTLARVLGRNRDLDSAIDMTNTLAPLQSLALETHTCIWFLAHHRKPGIEVSDAIDDLAGSTAQVAVADAILGLYRKSGESVATLKVTGRDLEERELALKWDALRFHWTVDGPAPVPHEREIMDFLRAVGEAQLTSIATNLGLSTRTIEDSLLVLLASKKVERDFLQSGQRGRPAAIYRPARGYK